MLAGRLALEAMLGVPCEPMQSLDLAYYASQIVTERSLVLALSSSGETTRTVEAVLVAQHRRALTVALTNTTELDARAGVRADAVRRRDASRLADAVVDGRAGPRPAARRPARGSR